MNITQYTVNVPRARVYAALDMVESGRCTFGTGYGPAGPGSEGSLVAIDGTFLEYEEGWQFDPTSGYMLMNNGEGPCLGYRVWPIYRPEGMLKEIIDSLTPKISARGTMIAANGQVEEHHPSGLGAGDLLRWDRDGTIEAVATDEFYVVPGHIYDDETILDLLPGWVDDSEGKTLKALRRTYVIGTGPDDLDEVPASVTGAYPVTVLDL